MISADSIKQRARALFPHLLSVRRHIHANPELSFQEFETSAYLQQQLSDAGVAFRAPVAGTGIVAELAGTGESEKVLMLRAELDALPINEENSAAYRSTRSGIMHACGHDVHMTCVLG